MISKLREDIFQLEQLLNKRNNKTSVFFRELLVQLDDGNILFVVNSIIHSYALTQYADFDYKEEKLFSEIWGIANQLNDKKSN